MTAATLTPGSLLAEAYSIEMGGKDGCEHLDVAVRLEVGDPYMSLVSIVYFP